jgi:predicted RNase H-like HicB family nuclease
MDDRLHYTIVIDPLLPADGGGFLATVPDLPGCMSDGETELEAVQNALDAILCWIEAARENNRPIPTPSYQRRAAIG